MSASTVIVSLLFALLKSSMFDDLENNIDKVSKYLQNKGYIRNFTVLQGSHTILKCKGSFAQIQ